MSQQIIRPRKPIRSIQLFFIAQFDVFEDIMGAVVLLVKDCFDYDSMEFTYLSTIELYNSIYTLTADFKAQNTKTK